MSRSILIVDENIDSAELLKTVLCSTGFGYVCVTTDSLDGIQNIIDHARIDTILFDNKSSNEFLLKRIKSLRLKNPQIRMLLLSKEITEAQSKNAHEHYVDVCCSKEDDYPELINAIEEVI